MAQRFEAHVLSQALDRLGKSPLTEADDCTLVSVAQEVWYEHSSLDAELRLFLGLNPDEIAVRRAGYLLEKLTRFPCVNDERVIETMGAVSCWLQAYRDQVEVTPAAGVRLRERRDELAVCWGLSEGLGLKVQALLPYQTRHYAATRDASFD